MKKSVKTVGKQSKKVEGPQAVKVHSRRSKFDGTVDPKDGTFQRPETKLHGAPELPHTLVLGLTMDNARELAAVVKSGWELNPLGNTVVYHGLKEWKTNRVTQPATPELDQWLKQMRLYSRFTDFHKGMIHALAMLTRKSEVQFIEDAIRQHAGAVVAEIKAQKKGGAR